MESSTSSDKISFEDSLLTQVIGTGKCVGCGACVVVCPFSCLEYSNGQPKLVKECKVCGICPKVCPQFDWAQQRMEEFVFGRHAQAEEEFGIFKRLAVAQTENSEILKVSQDGGLVTALVAFALEDGLVDGAIVSGVGDDKPLFPIPKTARNTEGILRSSGTRYFYSPNLLALAEAAKQKGTRIAFVGTPCQIRAARKMQMAGLKKYSEPVKYLIGLMCSECFTYEGLMEKHIHQKLGLDPRSITKMNIKGKMIVTTNKSDTTIPLADIKQYARDSCRFCSDFSSEMADISAGGLGLEGWTFAVVRTEKGEELFSNAEKARAIKTRDAREEAFALGLLHKLSKKKRQKSTPQPPT